MKNLKIVAFLIALVTVDAAFSAEVVTSNEGPACGVVEVISP
jgi:hypothetical protein